MQVGRGSPYTRRGAAPSLAAGDTCPCSSSQAFLFLVYGLILRECASSDLVRRHLMRLLELSHQTAGQREVRPQPAPPAPQPSPQDARARGVDFAT